MRHIVNAECGWVHQAQQEHLLERRRLEDQASSLQHRLAADSSRAASALDALRNQHANDVASLSDQLAAAQQHARVESARLSSRVESALAEVRASVRACSGFGPKCLCFSQHCCMLATLLSGACRLNMHCKVLCCLCCVVPCHQM